MQGHTNSQKVHERGVRGVTVNTETLWANQNPRERMCTTPHSVGQRGHAWWWHWRWDCCLFYCSDGDLVLWSVFTGMAQPGIKKSSLVFQSANQRIGCLCLVSPWTNQRQRSRLRNSFSTDLAGKVVTTSEESLKTQIHVRLFLLTFHLVSVSHFLRLQSEINQNEETPAPVSTLQ